MGKNGLMNVAHDISYLLTCYLRLMSAEDAHVVQC